MVHAHPEICGFERYNAISHMSEKQVYFGGWIYNLGLRFPMKRKERARREFAVNTTKRYKKGEIIFKEGDPMDRLYVVQSGRLSLSIERSGKKIELLTISKSQVLGEQGLFFNARQPFNAEAMQESQVMEVPVDIIKAQYNNSPPGVKLILKSLVDEVKQARQSLRSIKMEQDSSPCPQVAIPRIFTILNLVTRHTGKEIEVTSEPKEGEPAPAPVKATKVDFGTIKLYTARMFAESPQRMRHLVELLSKLGYVNLGLIKNEDGDEELDHIKVFDLQTIEDFAEFYQYNLYKGGKSEVIYVDKLAMKVAIALAEMGKDLQVDHKGAVAIKYDDLLEELKKKYRIDLKGTHLDILEKKGLFVQRVSRDDGAVLKLDKAEFQMMTKYWQLINEIDKWNEKGYIDFNESEENSVGEAGHGCPQCRGAISDEHKFCPHCGFKLAA